MNNNNNKHFGSSNIYNRIYEAITYRDITSIHQSNVVYLGKSSYNEYLEFIRKNNPLYASASRISKCRIVVDSTKDYYIEPAYVPPSIVDKVMLNAKEVREANISSLEKSDEIDEGLEYLQLECKFDRWCKDNGRD